MFAEELLDTSMSDLEHLAVRSDLGLAAGGDGLAETGGLWRHDGLRICATMLLLIDGRWDNGLLNALLMVGLAGLLRRLLRLCGWLVRP